MKSLQRRFQREQRRSPLRSSLIIFSESVRHQNFSRRTILHWFNKLVPEDEYDKKDKKKIIGQILDLSRLKSAEDGTKSTNN